MSRWMMSGVEYRREIRRDWRRDEGRRVVSPQEAKYLRCAMHRIALHLHCMAGRVPSSNSASAYPLVEGIDSWPGHIIHSLFQAIR